MSFIIFLPAILLFLMSFKKIHQNKKIFPLVTLSLVAPALWMFSIGLPYHLWDDYLVIDKLGFYVFVISSIVSIGVSLSLLTIHKHVNITQKGERRFYRFFALFWIGLILATLSNNMGIYWIGLEFATLSTVYMIKINDSSTAHKEAWNYMLVGAVGISLILFGIILIYASAKPILGEDAIYFDALLKSANHIHSPFLFELGFAITTLGLFIKMGFFPMNLWLANIERAAFYPVAALFSGILESVLIIGFFRFSQIAMSVNYSHIFTYIFIYMMLTIFIVSFLIYRAKDFIRLFTLSGIEHMALIILFWVSGGKFAALLHFAAHAFLKPALFLSTGVLESQGKYHTQGTLRGYIDKKGKLFAFIVSFFILAIISLPPSPMFFSELYGFSAMIHVAKTGEHPIIIIVSIFFLLLLLSVIFYRFILLYQAMNYEGVDEKKEVDRMEVLVCVLFAMALVSLGTPWVLTFIQGVAS